MKIFKWPIWVVLVVGCAVTTPRFIDPRPWPKRGHMESAEMPVHPRLGALMGVGPDPSIGCTPVGAMNEEVLLERARHRMLNLPGATNCSGDTSSAKVLRANEYCSLGYSYHGAFCTTIPTRSSSLDGDERCMPPAGGVIHLEPGQVVVDMDRYARASLGERGFPGGQYICHTHPCAKTFLSPRDVTVGLVALKFQGDHDAKGNPIYAPSIVRYAVSPTGEIDHGRPLEGWLRTPDREFKINLMTGEVWRKTVSREKSGVGIPWQQIGNCIVAYRTEHPDQQCKYTINPLW